MNQADTWPSVRSTFVRWAVLMIPIVAISVSAMLVLRSDRDDIVAMMTSGGRAAATVTGVEPLWVELSYDHELVGRVDTEMAAGLAAGAAVGDVIEIVHAADNPYRVRPVDEPIDSDATWIVAVATVLVAAAVLAMMQWSSRRARSLASESVVSYRMLATVHGRRWLRVPNLSLFALDADPGDRCICTVRLADVHPDALADVPFEVDVKGFPRTGGRVAIRRGSRTMWTRGRALLTARRRFPARPVPLPPPRTIPPPPWPFFDVASVRPALRSGPVVLRPQVPTLVLAGLLAAGLVGLLVAVAVTTVNARAVEDWMAAGRPAVATVADRPDEIYRLAVDVRPSDMPSTRLEMFANADFPEDYLTGDKYPAVLSEDSTRVRLLIERYDRTEPRLWVLLPTALIGWLLVRRLAGT